MGADRGGEEVRGTVRALGILLCVALLVSGCTDSFRQPGGMWSG